VQIKGTNKIYFNYNNHNIVDMEITQKSRTFTIAINKEEEGGYSGQCLELPGAISQGETLEELKTNMTDAINLVLEYIRDRAKKENSQFMEITT
jgi:predicted RNase H-like HicB family nuclease